MARNTDVILRALLGATGPITSSELAQVADVSARTVKRDMRDVAALLETHGARLDSGSAGYRVSVADEAAFRAYRSQMLDARGSADDDSQLRQIVCELLAHDYVTQDELAEKLYVSRSTIGKLMRRVRPVLDESQIVLSSRPHYGYYLIGKESNIRNFVVSRLLGEQDMATLDEPALTRRCRNYPEFLRVVTRQLVEGGHEELDPRTEGIVRYLVVTGARCAHGQHVDATGDGAVADGGSRELAEAVAATIADYFGTRMPSGEISYLASLLGNPAAQRDPEGLPLDASFFEKVVDDCIAEVKKVYGRDFSDDEDLRRGLVAHLYSTCSRMSIDAVLSLPMLEMVKAQYFEAYDYAVMCGHLLLERYGLRANEDSLGYIAMHFAAATERQRAKNRFQVVVVCESGRGTSELLRTRLEASFPTVQVTKVLSRAQLALEDLAGVALVVSTVPISTPIPVPCAQVTPLLGEKDVNRVRDYLDYFKNARDVRALFSPDLFFPGLEAKDKGEALAAVCERLADAGVLREGDADLLYQREKISSTEINPLVAMPHCIRENGERTFLAIFTTTRPIDWKHNDVQLIVAAVISREAGIDRRLFPMVYRLTKDAEKVRRLARITDFERFMDELFSPPLETDAR